MEARNPRFVDYFLFKKGYIATPAIFHINLLLYLLVSVIDQNFLIPEQATILKFGANANYLTLDGEWWRLITCMFLHYGPIHFLSNMYALTRMGMVLENFIGSWRFLFAYLFTGICASLLSTYWHVISLGVGASGAVFGMFGLFLALVTTEFVRKEVRWPLVKNIGLTILINLAIGTQFNIDNAAHIGGLIAGILSGYLIWIIHRLQWPKRTLVFLAAMAIFSVSAVVLSLQYIPKDPVKIVALLNSFEKELLITEDYIHQSEKIPQFSKTDSTTLSMRIPLLNSKLQLLKKYEHHDEVAGAINSFESELKVREKQIKILLNNSYPLPLRNNKIQQLEAEIKK